MYKFKPIVKTMVWGTETWVVSAVPGSESVVSEGPEAGKSITEIFPERFPLLIKFIDAHQDLSVQVHPDDRTAAERHGCNGKTEMWYLVRTAPGAHLLSGLSQRIDADEYERRIAEGTILEVLADHMVCPGDVFFLPAGRVHAICGGCCIAEIQQTSDITYRIYDYNRPGLDGKPRQLHTLEARDVIDYNVAEDYRTHYERKADEAVEIVRCPYFTTSLLELTKPYRGRLEDIGDFLIVICTEGSGDLNGSAIKAGEAAILTPEDKEIRLVPDRKSLTLLVCHR